MAAGGGGDALAALIIGRSLSPDSERGQVVASFSWDRYVIDPTPGPRRAADFADLGQISEHVWEVTPDSRLRTGGTSGLAILARHTKDRFFLLDPSDGVRGLHTQITELAACLSASQVVLVDVGGDIAARGDEPGLASPLADSLALAAVAGLPGNAEVVVAGPGLDGELTENHVRAQMASINARHHRVDAADAKSYRDALDHHPSEATALLSAAALGIEGRAEIRDSAALVRLSAASADLLVADCKALATINHVARRLATTQSFEEAERVTREICGRTELDHERAKAATLAETAYREPSSAQVRDRIAAHRVATAQRGANLISFRRLLEVAGLRRYDPHLIRATLGASAYDDVPLCRI